MYNSLNWFLVRVFEVWSYFEFGSEEGAEERGLIAPEEDLPACGNALGEDVRRNNGQVAHLAIDRRWVRLLISFRRPPSTVQVKYALNF